MLGHRFYNKEFTIDGVKCEYCGQILVGNDSHNWNCVVLKVENINKINSWGNTNISSGNYDYFGLCKRYGIEWTDYGKEQLRTSGQYTPPLTFSGGKLTHELSKSDFKQEYHQVYDTTRNNGGGYVVLSPMVSWLYRFGNIFNK